jgi:phenylacetate-CoA ligase
MSAFAEFREKFRAEDTAAMPALFARMRWSAGQLAELQTARLRELLACAAERSPFYARRLRGLDPARFELADLARVPSVSKPELMRELDDVFTDRRLSRALVERTLAATRNEPVPILDAYLAQATGGSSGRRGVFVSDASTWAEVSGGARRWIIAHAAAVTGLPPTRPRTIAVIGAASPVHSTGLVAATSPPGSGPVALVPVPVTLPLAEIVARLNELQPHQLLGYPSVLARLARERCAGRLAIEPGFIVATSEMLSPEARAAIRAGFGVPIVDVFGTTEGLMGATDPDGDVFAFNSDTCVVELVDAEDRPVPVGTPSAHALITNLCNRVQPLIRYRIEDRFTRHPDAGEHGHLRASVAGRSDEVLRWGALEIHPLVVRAALLKHPEVVDYQVRQTPCGVDAVLVADGALAESRLRDELRAALAAAGLAQPAVTVRRVDALERHAETGQVRRFLPLAG